MFKWTYIDKNMQDTLDIHVYVTANMDNQLV